VRPDPRLLPLFLALVTASCGGGPEPTTTSQKARVMARPGAVWGRDLARGLGLAEWELCSELGSYDCIAEAHLVTLGGIEPEVLGIDAPLPNASVSAPLAVERVAATACGRRYDKDQAGEPIVFVSNREEVARRLIERILGREATRADVQNLEALYDDLKPISSDLPRDWAVGACVVVATSTEALFY
jgi:hypothetical protein